MSKSTMSRVTIAGGLSLLGVLLTGAISGCGSGAPADPAESTAPSSTGQSQQDLWFFPHLCGGFGLECQDHDVCIPFMSKGCPGPKKIGFCFPRPHACPPISDPVCGCDGTTYTNLCDAAEAGTVMEHKGACAGSPPPPPPPTDCASGGTVCPGSGVCVSKQCQCTEVQPCQKGDTFNSDPTVCACEAQGPDPCARIVCPSGTMCVAASDGSTSCQ
ncbi:MAG TPA: Kazal-type serine protease inhibitor domain-containing protein [Polyangiaceae bacterium]|jgi:hypothetical protein|nr:Kazal-type serine protease inhibitor domain-containing protein [Polyangiaceae bacterium]